MYKDKTVNLDYILDNYQVLENEQTKQKDTKEEFIKLLREFYLKNPLTSSELQFKEHNGWTYLGCGNYKNIGIYSNKMSEELAKSLKKYKNIEIIENKNINKFIRACEDLSTNVPEIFNVYVQAYGSKGILIGIEEYNHQKVISFYIKSRSK